MKIFASAALMVLICALCAAQTSVIELTKQEALDLVVARDQVEEAMQTLKQRQERFNQLLADVLAKYGVNADKYGWIPTTGQLVPLKTNDEKNATTDSGVDAARQPSVLKQ